MGRFLGLLLVIVVLVVLAAVIFTPGHQRRAELEFISSDSLHDFDPHIASWMVDFRVLEAMFERLVVLDAQTMTVQPAAAERWDISDDGLTYTFHLRKDAKWSNGDPVTAHDYVRGWRRAMLPDTGAQYIEMMWNIKGARAWGEAWSAQRKAYENNRMAKSAQTAKALLDQAYERFEETVGLKAVDDHTLRVELERPIPYFIELAAFATFSPLHGPSFEKFVTVEPDTGLYKADADWIQPGNVVTNGPYVLTGYRADQDLMLEQSPHYWNREAMKNRSIYMKIMKDSKAALNYYESGRADWWPDVPASDVLAADLIDEQKQGRRNDVHANLVAGSYFYSFNCLPKLPDGRDNPFVDARVRLAFGLAIDRELLVTTILRAGQQAAGTYVPPVIPGYTSPRSAGMEFQPQRAKELLAEAGYPDGRGLEGLSLLYNTGFGHEKIASFVADQWREHLNVSVELDGMASTQFGESLRKQQYDIARANWFGDYRDPTTFLTKYHSQGGNNDAKWNNPTYDAILAEADSMTDVQARAARLAEAEALLLQEAPIIPVFFYVDVDLYDPARVSGIHGNAWNIRNLEKIQVKPDVTP